VPWSGAEGVRVWREFGADLVLTDVRMPDIDGLQAQLLAATALALEAQAPER
jgi:YesN/AraC family two-component response regulator